MSTAQRQFEVENNIETIQGNDAIFAFDAAEQKAIRNDAPWSRDPHFFKKVKVSAIALVKMVTHARSGGAIEVMGLMQGKVTADGTIIVLDSFALPVEGTETRVNAGAEAYEYMIQYATSSERVSRPENVVGWYHSHPGYGCWLSGIDVGTQMENQGYQDPWLAVVIDPNRTISAGAVEIGAFRTFPEDYKNPAAEQEGGAGGEWQSIPLAKIEDFGVHASRYYALEISHFKSSLDVKLLEALWNNYWVTTLSQSPLVTNRAYTTERMLDLSEKIKKVNRDMTALRRYGTNGSAFSGTSSGTRPQENSSQTKKVSELDKLCRDMDVIQSEEQHGLMTRTLKQRLFNFH